MSESKHTPTPWRAYRATDGLTYIGVGDSDGGGVLDGGFGLWRDGPEREANADFIVRAVNSYDDMLAALKQVEREIRAGFGSSFGETREQVRRAITKAESSATRSAE